MVEREYRAGETMTQRGLQQDPAWRAFRDRLRARWGDLPEDELEARASFKEALVGYLHDRTGASRIEVSRVLDEVSQDTGYSWR